MEKQYSLLPTWGYVPAGSDQGLKRLILTVILQAGRDAEKGSEEARAWLTGDICAWYCEFAGINFRAVSDWAENFHQLDGKEME